jgi:transposase
MAHPSTLFIGLEVHKETSVVASVGQERGAEVLSLGRSGAQQGDLAKLICERQSKGKTLHFVYEAGPCGYWWERSLTQKHFLCWVVAPSCIPQRAGDRVKPDRRDAGRLARRLRSGGLSPVSIPSGDDEALRALGRARKDVLKARTAAPVRLKAFLLRPDMRSAGRANWTAAHLRCLANVVCPTPAPQLGF